MEAAGQSVSAEGWAQLGRGTEGRVGPSAAGSSQLRTGPRQPCRAGGHGRECAHSSALGPLETSCAQCPSLHNSCKTRAGLMSAHGRNRPALQNQSLSLTEQPGESRSHSRHLCCISLIPSPSQYPPITTSITLMGTPMCLASDSAPLLRCHLVLMP